MMVQTRYPYAYVKKKHIYIMYIPGTVPVKSKVLEILRIKSHTKIEKAYVSNNILGELH